MGTRDELLAASASVQAYALVRALLDHLHDTGKLADEELIAIIEAGCDKLEMLVQVSDNPAFEKAAQAMADEADGARRALGVAECGARRRVPHR